MRWLAISYEYHTKLISAQKIYRAIYNSFRSFSIQQPNNQNTFIRKTYANRQGKRFIVVGVFMISCGFYRLGAVVCKYDESRWTEKVLRLTVRYISSVSVSFGENHTELDRVTLKARALELSLRLKGVQSSV